MTKGTAFDRIRADTVTNDLLSLYEHTTEDNDYTDSPFQYSHIRCNYFERKEFSDVHQRMHNSLSYFHLNCRGLLSNWDSFYDVMCQLNNDSFSFDCIGTSENYQTLGDTRLSLNGYHDIIARCRDDGSRGSVGLFLKNNINFKIRDNISVFMPHVFESLFAEIISQSEKPTQFLGSYIYHIPYPELTWTFFRVLFFISWTLSIKNTNIVLLWAM